MQLSKLHRKRLPRVYLIGIHLGLGPPRATVGTDGMTMSSTASRRCRGPEVNSSNIPSDVEVRFRPLATRRFYETSPLIRATLMRI